MLSVQARSSTPVVMMIAAPGVSPEPVRVRVVLPPGYHAHSRTRYPTLYINDGQDMEAVGVEETVADLERRQLIRPMIVVAVDMPRDRMAGYGVSDRAKGVSVVAPTKYGPVGANAQAYSQWLVNVVVPRVDAQWRTRRDPGSRWLLGWSLGAINAFSVGWQYPRVFGAVGAFSPSFWLATDSTDARTLEQTRIAHALIERAPAPQHSRFFIEVGDAEEKDDRDGDGVIDVIDDALDLIQGWTDGGGRVHPGLKQLGYGVDVDDGRPSEHASVVFRRLPGGEHNQKSWARMMPAFLRWVDSAQTDGAVQQVCGKSLRNRCAPVKSRRKASIRTR